MHIQAARGLIELLLLPFSRLQVRVCLSTGRLYTGHWARS